MRHSRYSTCVVNLLSVCGPCCSRKAGLEDSSKEQLFYMAAGQMWCSKYSRDSIADSIARDLDAPPFSRIKSVAQNYRLRQSTIQSTFKTKESLRDVRRTRRVDRTLQLILIHFN
jgi:hypothetical protein